LSNPALKPNGFTLLEVMIVVFIIGIITSLAVYSMKPIGPAREAKREAQSLMATLDYAQQQAIISHQPYGLVVYESGYQFFVFQGQWLPAPGDAFSKKQVRSRLQLLQPKVNLDGTPSIVLMPSKEPSVYDLLFSLQGYHWHIRSQPPQAITLTAGSYE
jgi:prepilin-type N-terminal cleavage/methylation domain-containing protein